MTDVVKNVAAGALLGGSLLFTAGLGIANAEPMPGANVVDLAIGNIKILQGANLDTAASVAGAVCNINTSQANSLAQRATTESNAQTVCSLPGGMVTFSQAGSISGGAGPAQAPAVGTPQSQMGPASPMNPMGPMSPPYPSDQQPG
jgi:hypothetical protein